MSERGNAPAAGIDFDRLSEDETMAVIDAFLNRLSVAGLQAVVDAAQEKQQAKQEGEREALLAEFRQRAASLGLRVKLEPLDAPVVPRKPRSDRGQPQPVRYRGPSGETWSGRGRAPNWLAAYEAVGQNREDFRVTEESE
jgi:DNA-binding protein H-NS